MRSRLVAVTVSLALVAGTGVWINHLTNKVSSLEMQLRSSKEQIASLRASHDRVVGMYTSALEIVSKSRTESLERHKDLSDAIKEDEASRDWGSQRIPSRVRSTLQFD